MKRLSPLVCLLPLLLAACEKESSEPAEAPSENAVEASAPESAEAPETPEVAPPAWAKLELHGAMRTVNLEQNMDPVVQISDALPKINHGVGALGGLLGEVTVLDEAVYVARSGGDVGFDRYDDQAELEGLDATLLFGARVETWETIELDERTDRDALAARLEAWRDANAPGQPVPFRVFDPAANVDWHVVDATRFPEGGAVNCEERKELSHKFDHEGVEATLVGIFTTDHTGVVVDHTTPIHAHVVLAVGPSGHLDTFTLSEDARLMVPALP